MGFTHVGPVCPTFNHSPGDQLIIYSHREDISQNVVVIRDRRGCRNVSHFSATRLFIQKFNAAGQSR